MGSRVPFAPGICDHVAEPIDVPEHLIEIIRGAIKLAPIALAVEELHRMFDGKDLVEELRDCLPQLQGFRPS